MIPYTVAAAVTHLAICVIGKLVSTGKVSGQKRRKLVSLSSLEAYIEGRK